MRAFFEAGCGRRRAAWLSLATAFTAGAVGFGAATTEVADSRATRCSWSAIPPGSASARWPACRRPYEASSPFNTRLRRSPRLAPGSDAIVARLGGELLDSVAVGGLDWGVPIYRSRRRDPLYRLNCTRRWGRCEVEGARVRIPAAARPAGLWPDPTDLFDGHLTVVDSETGYEYDLWNVESKPRRGGRLDFAWGGRARIAGNGLGSGSIAARYAGLAGVIRAREFVSGRINHALLMVVNCTEGVVYPASSRGLSCAEAGLSPVGAPPMGARIRLAMGKQEIAALGLPRWQRGILRALARYGAFVSDTGGANGRWGFEYESGASFASFGDRDPRVALAGRLGLPPYDSDGNGVPEYSFLFANWLDWSRLQVIAPCVTRMTCR